jgi:hypothetical protein
MELGLSDRIAPATGGRRSIDTSTRTDPAREGANVGLIARDQVNLNKVAPSITDMLSARAIIHAPDAGATKRAELFDSYEENWLDGFALKFHGYGCIVCSAWAHLCQTKGYAVNIVGIGPRLGSAEVTIRGRYWTLPKQRRLSSSRVTCGSVQSAPACSKPTVSAAT